MDKKKIVYSIKELIENSEKSLKRTENGYLNGDMFSTEEDWLIQLNLIKGRLEGYKRILKYIEELKSE